LCVIKKHSLLYEKTRTNTPLSSYISCSTTQTKNYIDQPYLEISGSADTLVTPNEIYIKIVISEKDTKDRTSLEELELKMYDALKALGIPVDNSLTTSDMASNFKFYFLKSKDVMKSKQYILKVGDAVTASKVFIELENLGVSNTQLIELIILTWTILKIKCGLKRL
jgi:uncharacterized protein